MKAVIFDWSGVVRDTVTSQLWIVNRIFETYGVDLISLEEFRENWEQPYSLFYQKYLGEGYSEEEQRTLYREAVLDPNGPKSPAYPGMVDLIKRCKSEGAFLAVVSSDLQETLLLEIKQYGLEDVFNEVITDVNDKFEPVQKLIEENALDLQNTFFIGDSNHEVDVAKKAGIRSIAVTWGFTSEQKLRARNPDYVAHTAQELEGILFV